MGDFEDRVYEQSGKELTSEWQREVLALVIASGTFGITDVELQKATKRGHGSTSSALSTLHKKGFIHRLKEKRGKNTVYVHPKNRMDRDILPPMTNKGLIPVDHEDCEALEAVLVNKIEALESRIALYEAKLTSRGISLQ